MLFNYKDFSYINIDEFLNMVEMHHVDNYIGVEGESFLYGEYEFVDGSREEVVFPGKIFKEWTTREYVSSGTYSGYADADGSVTLSEDVDYIDVSHKICRRDLSSLDDELERYAEYCFYYVSALTNDANNAFNNAEASGRSVEDIYYKIQEVTRGISWNLARTDVKYIVDLKKKLCDIYENYFKKPYTFQLYGKTIAYPFISKIMAPGEEKLLDKKNLREREKVHFAYLEKEAEWHNENYLIDEKPRRSGALFVLSIIFLSFWGLMTGIGALSGYFSGVKNGGDPIMMMLQVAGWFALLASPFFIIGLIFRIKVEKQFKEHKKYIKEHNQKVLEYRNKKANQ